MADNEKRASSAHSSISSFCSAEFQPLQLWPAPRAAGRILAASFCFAVEKKHLRRTPTLTIHRATEFPADLLKSNLCRSRASKLSTTSISRPDRPGLRGRRRASPPASRRRGHLHHRSQHQLHQLLHGILHLLRLLSPAAHNGKPSPLDEGYILDFETIYEKIAETLEMGGTGVLMQGGIHPDLKIDWFERLFRGIKQRFPQIWLHCLSASEILAIAEYSESRPARHHRPPARCRPRFHPRRRRGNSRRRSPPSHRAPQMRHRRLGQRASHRTSARHAHHRHHDVRRRRKFRSAHQPF